MPSPRDPLKCTRDTKWPKKPDLQTAVDFVKANPDLFARIRETSRIADLGYLLSDGSGADAWAFEDAVSPSENSPLLEVYLVPGDKLPTLAMYLHLEGTWGRAGNWDLAAKNVIALEGIWESKQGEQVVARCRAGVSVGQPACGA